MTGIIIKGVGGFYDVLSDGEIIVCKARGRFRKEHVKPMIGDIAEIRMQPEGYAAIDRLLPRRNALIRPPVANIDQLIIVTAASHPAPDWLLVDKLILHCALLGVKPVLVLNKIDERLTDIVNQFCSEYDDFETVLVSTLTGEGLDAVRTLLAGKISCLAGQSAVGKSSLMNALFPELSLEVGDLSERTERGRHTTRHAQLWPFLGGAVLDTPGFSLFELTEIEQAQLDAAYPEFGDAPTKCRFTSCSHISEPSCAVKALLGSRLTEGRYKRYQEIYAEIAQRRKERYD